MLRPHHRLTYVSSAPHLARLGMTKNKRLCWCASKINFINSLAISISSKIHKDLKRRLPMVTRASRSVLSTVSKPNIDGTRWRQILQTRLSRRLKKHWWCVLTGTSAERMSWAASLIWQRVSKRNMEFANHSYSSYAVKMTKMISLSTRTQSLPDGLTQTSAL